MCVPLYKTESYKGSTTHWFTLKQQLKLFSSSQAFHFNDTPSTPREGAWTHTQLWMNTNTNVVVINHWKDLEALSTHASGIQPTSITGNLLSINNWSWCWECNRRNKITNFSNCTWISEHMAFGITCRSGFTCILSLSNTAMGMWVREKENKKKKKTQDGGHSRSGCWTGNT